MVNETRGDYPVVGHYSHLVHGQRSANGGELPHRTTCTGVQNGDGGEGHRIDNYGVPVVEEGQLFLRMRGVFFFFIIFIIIIVARCGCNSIGFCGWANVAYTQTVH